MRARDNPMRTERVRALRCRPVGWTWESLLADFDRLGRRCAVVGPQGSGKTTLFDALAWRLCERGDFVARLTLRAGERYTPGDASNAVGDRNRAILLLDGAEQVPPRTWRQFLRETDSLPGMIVTCHRPGLLPTLLVCSTSASLLDDLLGELLPPEAIVALGTLPRDSFARHGGNVRLVMLDLYDHFASR